MRTALVLALIGATVSAHAQALSDEGTVIRLDPPSRVLTLEDGRMYRAVAGTSFVIDSRPETFDGLRPGVRLVVIGGEPVVYRQGRYIALPPAPAATLGIAASPSMDSARPESMATPALTPATALPTSPTLAPPLPAAVVLPRSAPPVAWRPANVLPSPPSAP